MKRKAPDDGGDQPEDYGRRIRMLMTEFATAKSEDLLRAQAFAELENLWCAWRLSIRGQENQYSTCARLTSRWSARQQSERQRLL